MTNPYMKNVSLDSGTDRQVFTIRIDADTPSDAMQLAQAIETCARHGGGHGDTVVLELALPDVPVFVEKAVCHLVGFGVGLVVVHNGQCSLNPDCTLPKDLLTAIGKAARDGQVWDPIANKTVYMYPARPY
jgi:hypothetical protein